MNSHTEIHGKLLKVIKDMMLSNPDLKVPSAVENYILEEYGFTLPEKGNSEADLNDFAALIQDWVNDSHSKGRVLREEQNEEVAFDFGDSFDKYLEIQAEYADVTSRLVDVLQDLVLFKEKYSEEFKNKCRYQETSMDVLTKKVLFLRMQFFLKLYRENDSLNAHLKLRDKLRKEVEMLKAQLASQIELNRQYDEIKSDEKYLELFKMYKELKKIEKRAAIVAGM